MTGVYQRTFWWKYFFLKPSVLDLSWEGLCDPKIPIPLQCDDLRECTNALTMVPAGVYQRNIKGKIGCAIGAGRGGHRTYFVNEGNNWGGDTAQHWKQKQLLKLDWVVGSGLVWSGLVGSGLVLTENNTTSWLHLASRNLPDSQLSCESKMEPSMAITTTATTTTILVGVDTIEIHLVLLIYDW